MNGLIKVRKQLNLPQKTILLFDSDIPKTGFSKLQIDGKEYTPGVVYDLKGALGIPATGDFEGKEVKFIK